MTMVAASHQYQKAKVPSAGKRPENMAFEKAVREHAVSFQKKIDQEFNDLSTRLKKECKETFLINYPATYKMILHAGIKNYQDAYTEKIIAEFNKIKGYLKQDMESQLKELIRAYCQRILKYAGEELHHPGIAKTISPASVIGQFDFNAYVPFDFHYEKGETSEYVLPSFIDRLWRASNNYKHFLKRMYDYFIELITINNENIIPGLQAEIPGYFSKFYADLIQFFEDLSQQST